MAPKMLLSVWILASQATSRQRDESKRPPRATTVEFNRWPDWLLPLATFSNACKAAHKMFEFGIELLCSRRRRRQSICNEARPLSCVAAGYSHDDLFIAQRYLLFSAAGRLSGFAGARPPGGIAFPAVSPVFAGADFSVFLSPSSFDDTTSLPGA